MQHCGDAALQRGDSARNEAHIIEQQFSSAPEAVAGQVLEGPESDIKAERALHRSCSRWRASSPLRYAVLLAVKPFLEEVRWARD